jgi:hypothetical protein
MVAFRRLTSFEAAWNPKRDRNRSVGEIQCDWLYWVFASMLGRPGKMVRLHTPTGRSVLHAEPDLPTERKLIGLH